MKENGRREVPVSNMFRLALDQLDEEFKKRIGVLCQAEAEDRQFPDGTTYDPAKRVWLVPDQT